MTNGTPPPPPVIIPERRDSDIPTWDTGRILAILYTVLFGGMVAGLFFVPIPEANQATINQLIGIMSAIQLAVIKFYFDGTKSAETTIKAGIAGRVKADDVLQNIALKVPDLPPMPPAVIPKAEPQPKGEVNETTVTK